MPTRGQPSATAAEIYEQFFVPALFARWAPLVADAARLRPGDTVLDLACGTGVLAREALARVRPSGAVTGLDPSEGMLAVARRMEPAIAWREGRAENLPFPDGGFSAVVSQFGLMFFEDRPAAVREMHRVLASGGRLVVAVWDSLDRTPAYATLVSILDRLFGVAVADQLRAPFSIGDTTRLGAIFRDAGIDDATVVTRSGASRFPSIRVWIETNVRGWTFAEMIDDDGLDRLVAEAERELARYLTPSGAVESPMQAHIVTVVKH